MALLDLVTKFFVQRYLAVGDEIPILPFLNITHVHNPGVAFGFLNGLPEAARPYILAALAAAIGIWLIVQLRNTSADAKLEIAIMSVVLGGAVGNLINRVTLGHVTDFIDLHWQRQYHYPAFNIADIAICLGVVGMILGLAQSSRS